MDKEITGKLIGLHSFVAYKGNIRYDHNLWRKLLGYKISKYLWGIAEIQNEVVYRSPVVENMIVTTGKALTLNRLFGLSSAVAITSIGVGTDSTAAALSQIKLNPSVAGTVLIQTADAGTALVGTTVTISSTFAPGVGTFQWNEAGLFNGNVNGTSVMFNRTVIGPYTKQATDSIVYQIQVTQS